MGAIWALIISMGVVMSITGILYAIEKVWGLDEILGFGSLEKFSDDLDRYLE